LAENVRVYLYFWAAWLSFGALGIKTDMTNAEREQLKDSLRAMAAGRGDGIDIDTPFRWNVEGIDQPEPFFRCLPILLPDDAILYLECDTIPADVSSFYEAHRASKPVAVVRDMIFPVPDTYHVALSQELLNGLNDFAAKRRPEELFNHIKAYRGESLLFSFHDAFAGCLLISEHVAEPVVAEFCSRLGVSYNREQNIINRDPEQLHRFLWALENPDKVKLAGEPWWRRLWRRCTGKDA
jgi:hypothetical protein